MQIKWLQIPKQAAINCQVPAYVENPDKVKTEQYLKKSFGLIK